MERWSEDSKRELKKEAKNSLLDMTVNIGHFVIGVWVANPCTMYPT